MTSRTARAIEIDPVSILTNKASQPANITNDYLMEIRGVKKSTHDKETMSMFEP